MHVSQRPYLPDCQSAHASHQQSAACGCTADLSVSGSWLTFYVSSPSFVRMVMEGEEQRVVTTA